MDHVALVVRRIETVLERLEGLGLAIGRIDEFPAEGTREVYIGDDASSARLLLMQPIRSEGPYGRALSRRGPGLHHVAVNVSALEHHVASLRGWLLHPQSLETLATSRTVWLARPGIRTLIELREATPVGGPRVVEALEVGIDDAKLAPLLEPYGLVAASHGQAQLVLAGQRFTASALAG